MASTQITRHIRASPAAVYRALIDAQAIASWRVPVGMTSHVHEFDAREGGSFRISLTYESSTGAGKTTAHTDTYHGHFEKLVADEEVVEVLEFETDNPDLRGEMKITTRLAAAGGRYRCGCASPRDPRRRDSQRQRDRDADGVGQSGGLGRGVRTPSLV
jgi:uncharacterized protein YndB with AHSA1/START domain